MREIELEVIPAAQEYGLGIIPWSPLQGGLLGGVLRKENRGRPSPRGPGAGALEAHRDQIEAVRGLRRRARPRARRLALAWLLHQPAVTAPIVGPRTMEQLDAALRALDIKLDDKALARLDEIFPGLQDRPRGLRLVTGGPPPG